jgi:hypothetical protein
MHKVVTLSDGQECRVRVLGLFEIRKVALDGEPGPFFEVIHAVSGEVIKEPYIPPKETPVEPEVPREDAKEKSQLWYHWMEYDKYQEYLVHLAEQKRIADKYYEDCAAYILANCLAPADQDRIIEQEDWDKVEKMASVPTVSREDITAALGRIFQGQVQ